MSTYEPSGMAMLRAAAWSSSDLRRFNEMSAEQRRSAASENPRMRSALLIASASLAESLTRPDSARSAAQSRRLDSRLYRYMSRMSSRPTPFGMFSGVATCELGSRTGASIDVGALDRVRVRPDHAWLRAATQRSATGSHHRWQTNDLLREEGAWWVLDAKDVDGQGVGAVRIRRTEPAAIALTAARDGATTDEIVAVIAARYPDTSRAVIGGLVEQLIDKAFLVDTWRPPLVSANPLGDLIAAQQSSLSHAPLLRGLEDVGARASEATAQGAEVSTLEALTHAQAAVVPDFVGPSYQVDATLSVDEPVVNQEIGLAVAEAVSTLMQLAQGQPKPLEPLSRWRRRFEERYGVGALVPVKAALSPVEGIGAPAGYAEPAGQSLGDLDEPQESADSFREAICAFAAEALSRGKREVSLTDEWVARFSGADSGPGVHAPAVEAFVEVAAADTAAVDQGQWLAVMRPDGMALGGRAFGRFHDLFDGGALAHLAELVEREESFRPDACHAELTYLSKYARSGNVATRPRLRKYEVPVNMPATVDTEHVIRLDDILVGSNGQRLFLWSRRLDREVVVSEGHLLSLQAAPNPCRFLVEVSQDGYVLPIGFGWGPLAYSPFLPRVLRGKVVLRVAQWALRKSLLDEAFGADSSVDPQAAIRAWRSEWGVPRYVYLVDADNRLLIDFQSPTSVEELLSERKLADKPLVLQEALPGPEDQWLSDPTGSRHASELVIPVILKPDSPTLSSPGIRSWCGRDVTSWGRLPHQVGGEWLSLKLYLPQDRQNDLLVEHLQPLMESLQAQGALEHWFYLRYADPDPHLRLRVRTTAARADDAVELTQLITRWADDLARTSLLRDITAVSFMPEIARYGGPDVYPFVESLFTASSMSSLRLLADWLPEEAAWPVELVTLAAVDQLAKQLTPTSAERQELAARLGGAQDSGDYKKHRDDIAGVLGSTKNQRHVLGREWRERIDALLAPQLPHCHALRAALDHASAEGTLVGSRDSVLGSVLHMQVNRLMPSGGASERLIYVYWRLGLQSVLGGGR